LNWIQRLLAGRRIGEERGLYDEDIGGGFKLAESSIILAKRLSILPISYKDIFDLNSLKDGKLIIP
jgi:hypothetical protein